MAPKRRDRDSDAGKSAANVATAATEPAATAVALQTTISAQMSSANATHAAGNNCAIDSSSNATTGGTNGSACGSVAIQQHQLQHMQHLQSDTDMFLQAFEKPTQIYRYLRTRNMISPVFLHRNLTYMKERTRRTNRARATFQVNSLLAIKQQQMQRARNEMGAAMVGSGGHGYWLGEYMTLMFLGFHDKTLTDDDVVVEVETYLSHISHKKRKDSSKTLQERIGVSVVKVNPEDSAAAALSKIPAVSVATNNLNANTASSGTSDPRKSFILQLNVTVRPVANNNGNNDNLTADAAGGFALTNHLRDLVDLDADLQQHIDHDGYHTLNHHHHPHLPQHLNAYHQAPTAKRLRTAMHLNYESELVVFDKQSRCLLTDGEYELALKERPVSVKSAYSPKKHPTWETIPDTGIASLDKAAFDDYSVKPVLKFRLAWTKEQCAELVDRPLPITVIKKQQQLHHHGGEASGTDNNNDSAKSLETAGATQPPSPAGVDYYFIYNNNTRQQTEACEDYHCPWCSLNCIALYSLLKHLKLCHSRFTFTYVPNVAAAPTAANAATSFGSAATASLSSSASMTMAAVPAVQPVRARIDVCINELFDGSYTGSPNDLVGPSGFAFSRAGPVQRTIVTRILVCRPRRTKPTLNEFLEIDENELNSQRPYITGHNRLYHHTMTCLPVHPKELDIDSEGENDPAWLQHKTMMMIDEFTDVNEGEKELMKMWNLHIMKNGYVGDIQIPLACDMFIDLRGHELLAKNLFRNFIVHVSNLSDCGLVSAEAHLKIAQKLHRLLITDPIGRTSIANSLRAQSTYWQRFGLERQQQKLCEEAALPPAKRDDGPQPLPTLMPSVAGGNSGMMTTRTTTSALALQSSSASLSLAYNNTAGSTLPSRLTSGRNEATGSGNSNFQQQLPSGTTTLVNSKRRDSSSKGRENSKPNRSITAAAAAAANVAGPSHAAAGANVVAPVGNKRRFSHLRDASVSFETALSADYGDECVGRRSSLVDVKTRASSSSSSLQMPKMPLLCSGNGIRSDRLRMKAIVASMQTNRMTVLLKRIKWK